MEICWKFALTLFVAALTFTFASAQKCWQCSAEVRDTTDITKQPACVTGEVPGEGVSQMDCPEGKCIKYTSLNQGEPPYMSRGCLTLRKQQKKMCDGGPGLKDVACCEGNLCNAGNKATTIKFGTLGLISISAIATVFNVFY